MSEPFMEHKVAVVTGANGGIGKVTSLHLAQAGADLVMACRNRQRGQAALAEIEAATGNRRLHLVNLDLTSFDSVRQAAREITESFPAIDVLVNNAGYLPGRREVTDIGVEQSFFVNYLSPFLFTNLLLPAIRHSREGRIINVSSDIHRIVKIPWDDLSCSRRYGPYYAYAIGKLGNVMFTHELVRRLAREGADNVTVNVLHPGYIATEFGDDTYRLLSLAIKLVRPLLLTPEKGAATQIHLAMGPEVQGLTGQYFKAKRKARASSYSKRDDECARLWQLSCKLTGLDT